MAKITANFSDRDSANLSLMRLRRGGVDFDLMSLTSTPNPDSSVSHAVCLSGMSNLTSAETITCPQYKADVTAATNPDGSIAWSEEDFATAHMGWKCILAYEGEDGLDYLVRYAPDMFQGIAHYRCEQFYVDNSNISSYEEVLLQEWSVEFEV